MGFEIDFLPAGDGSRSGDAIALRFGNLDGSRDEQRVVVIDGGFQKTGEELVEHIDRYYKTERADLVISTHPDADHVNGLRVVLEEMRVDELWLHRPSNRRATLERLARRIEDVEQRQAFRKALEAATDLEELADGGGIPIREPFVGVADATGAIRVAGPTEEFYSRQLELAAAEPQRTALQRFFERMVAAVHRVAERWEVETLTDEGETSAINNTSVVTLFSYDERHSLLTADAGIPALTEVAGRLEAAGLGGGGLGFVQVPHHGSKRNVGPTVLDRLLGPRKPEGKRVGSAFVSAAPDGEPKHPAKKGTNAFLRRGYPVHATRGDKKRHHHQAPPREGWTTSEPLPLYAEVEE